MNQSFAQLGLSAELMKALTACGYDTATPIQVQAIPQVLAGRDLLASAQTGTGKTAAFTLPILQRLQQAGPRPARPVVRVLVLVPTRELAAQVRESIHDYGKFLPFRSTVIFGGVGIGPQITELRRGVDIVVATPGRLLDHMQQGTVRLDKVETLVLDEADRMLDMGFIRDIRKIISALPPARQNLLFSATFSAEIRALASSFLRNPVEVQVARPNAAATGVSHVVHPVDRSLKRSLLAKLIRDESWSQVLVFTRTKHGANRLSEQLVKDGLRSAAIHGNKSQGARTRALADFKDGKVRVLVATDIAARGLDIEQLPLVVNYEMPMVPEDYVHRIGRTGRAGMEGHAISLVSADEKALLADVEKVLKRRLDQVVVPGFEPGTGTNRELVGAGDRPSRGGPSRGARPAGRSARPAAGGRSGGGRSRR
jgi:ATP-dependent RNA helicase RhlE